MMQAQGKPDSLHAYFSACATRGVSVDEAAAMDVDLRLRDEHRGFIAWMHRHECSPHALSGGWPAWWTAIKLLRQQPADANLFDGLPFELDYDDYPDEEQPRTELYCYYNPVGASLSFVVSTRRCTSGTPNNDSDRTDTSGGWLDLHRW